MRKVSRIFFIGVVLMALSTVAMAQNDDAEFRLLVTANPATVDGTYAVDLQMRIAPTFTTPRNLNSLTVDVTYPTTLAEWTSGEEAGTNWALSAGYETSVSKLSGYYRVLVTGNGVPAGGAAFSLTDAWQSIVTLRWKIATVSGYYDIAMATDTDCGAYFSAAPPSDLAEWDTAPKAKSGLLLTGKLFLNGPYSAGSHVMNTSLRDGGYVPLTSPYTDDARTVASIPSTVTDWVLLQLRSTDTGATVSSSSVLLRGDGQIVGDDGTATQVTINSIEGDKDYYLIAKHRNHIGVMSAAAFAMNGSTAATYDFTTALTQYYGGEAKELETNVYGLFAGDANGSTVVNSTDYFAVKPNLGSTGYYNADANLSSIVNSTDYFAIKPNLGKTTNIP